VISIVVAGATFFALAYLMLLLIGGEAISTIRAPC
jgi:hypothetical protein